MADKLVCVGGSADGGSCSIEKGCRTVTKMIRRETQYRYMWGAEAPDEVVTIDTVVYRRERLHVGGKEIEFLVYAPMSTFDAVKKLLEDHRP